jgi:predicted DNA-binding protein (MmcQ/YjbR family)
MSDFTRAEAKIRKFALSYPESTEDHPWGHVAIKVRSKAFVFMALEGNRFSLSVKLPESSVAALMLPFASPTGYGLGKSGWVSAKFEGKSKVPVALLQEWVDESYRAIAPKRVVATLDGDAPARSKKKRSEKRQ